MQNGLDQILAQCARLMAKKGYHGTSMRNLARVTDRSLAGLYHYFKNKQELLYLINQRGFSFLLYSAQRLARRNLTPAEWLRALIENHVNYFAGHLNEMRVMMLGTLELNPRQDREIRQLKDDYKTIVADCVADLWRTAGHREFTAAALNRKTYLLFGMMNWIYGWYSRNEHGTRRELTDDIFATFTEGLCAPPRAEAAA
jgi:AcrR family transcriptional regulator